MPRAMEASQGSCTQSSSEADTSDAESCRSDDPRGIVDVSSKSKYLAETINRDSAGSPKILSALPPKVPTIRNVANVLVDYMPFTYIDPRYTEAFLVSTAEILLSNPTESWKDLSSDNPTLDANSVVTGGSNKSKSVGFWNIAADVNKRIRRIPVEHTEEPHKELNLCNFRRVKGGMIKFFKKKLIKADAKILARMDRFGSLYCGYICKLYCSKVGYNCTYEMMKSDLDDIIDKALGAADVDSMFKYRLVLPANFKRFDLMEPTFDTDDIQMLTRPHILSKLTAPSTQGDISVYRNEVHAGSTIRGNVSSTDEGSYEQRIQNRREIIDIYEEDMRQLSQELATKKAQVCTLQMEVQNLEYLKEQDLNNSELVTNVRAFVNNEKLFKDVSALMIGVLPTVLPILAKVDASTLQNRINEAVLLLNEDVNTDSVSTKFISDQEGEIINIQGVTDNETETDLNKDAETDKGAEACATVECVPEAMSSEIAALSSSQLVDCTDNVASSSTPKRKLRSNKKTLNLAKKIKSSDAEALE